MTERDRLSAKGSEARHLVSLGRLGEGKGQSIRLRAR